MREGSKSMTVCQPMVMMLVWPLHAELTSTIGPGSRKRRIWETGRSFLEAAFMGPSREHWEENCIYPYLAVRSIQAFTFPPPRLERPMGPTWDGSWEEAWEGPWEGP